MADLESGTAAEIEVGVRTDPDGVHIVSLAGELDSSNVQRLNEAIAPLLAERPERLIFDLGALRFMDSAGIAVLVGAAVEVNTVQIRNPAPIVKRVIEVTGLSDVLRIVP
jgi:anti-anti-sigma factor